MKNDQKFCECCGQVIVDYPVTLTKRNVYWLWALGKIGKYDKADQNNWVNYKDVHALVAEKFGKFVNGVWKPVVLSGYGTMAGEPWKLIENNNESKEKFRSNGDWRLTPRGILFLRGELQVPEQAWFNHLGCYKSTRMIYIHEVKLVNFDELTNLFNSF